MPVKVIYGSEPYIIDKKITEIKKEVLYPEMNLSFFSEIDEQIKDAMDLLPVMDDKRIVFLAVDELKQNDTLLKLIKSVPDTTEFIVVSKSVDKRSAIYKYLSNNRMFIECSKVSEGQLRTFIVKLLNENGCKITNKAYELLLDSANYFEDPNVSLYTIEIYVKQLIYLSKIITENEVQKVVPMSSNSKIYELSKALLCNKGDKAFSLALDFVERGENVIGMLSMLLRLFRLAFKASLYNDVDRSELGALLGVPVFQFKDALNIPTNKLSQVLDIIQNGINGIKSGRCDEENMFLLVVGSLFSILNPTTVKIAEVVDEKIRSTNSNIDTEKPLVNELIETMVLRGKDAKLR